MNFNFKSTSICDIIFMKNNKINIICSFLNKFVEVRDRIIINIEINTKIKKKLKIKIYLFFKIFYLFIYLIKIIQLKLKII